MPSVPASPLYLPTAMTADEACARIARVVGGAANPDVLDEALDALHDALRWWDRFHPWQYLRVLDDTIGVVASTADYSLPSNFKHPYTVRLSTAARRLAYVDQRLYDMVRWSQSSEETPTHYSLFKVGSELKITLLPTPDAADTLVLKYHRVCNTTPSGGDLLDIPDSWVDVILNRAKELVLGDRTGREGDRQFFGEQAQYGIMRARADDIVNPDDQSGFNASWAPGYDANHAWAYVTETYGF